eukprot:m.73527 g.73527  ORF g.73527 m.73527 type:complete len:85 (+) comp50301_c0_seq25:812-1066(+)
MRFVQETVGSSAAGCDTGAGRARASSPVSSHTLLSFMLTPSHFIVIRPPPAASSRASQAAAPTTAATSAAGQWKRWSRELICSA